MTIASKMDDVLNANIAIDNIWLLPTPRASDALRDRLELEDELPEALLPFVRGWSEDEIEELLDGDTDAFESLFQEMVARGWCGFIIDVSTPVMRMWGKHKSWSWGETWNKIFVAPTVEEALDAAIAWANERATVVQADAA